MRSRVKASSTGSTQGRGSRSGSFVSGADATRGSSSDLDGSGAPTNRLRIVALALPAALLVLALFASSAFASKELLSDFGTLPGSGENGGSYGGDLKNPRDIAANGTGVGPANPGDVYVADEENNRIERFDSAGNFVSAWGKDTIAPSINERQRIVISENASGSYTLTFEGATSEATGINTAFSLRNTLESVPTIGGGNVEVTGQGTPADPFIVTFKGALGGANQPVLTADTSELSGKILISTVANGSPNVAHDAGAGFERCTVATECQAGVASGENGALDHPQSVAVDPDTGNVYVSDRGNRRIDEFDGEGNFIRAFGFDVAESGPGDTGTGYEVCNESAGDVCKAGVGGSGVGQYGTGNTTGFGIAVSPADGNAATGTAYLADSGNRRVDTYDLDGASPSSFGSSANFGSEQPRSVAVDSRGIVYASDSNNGGDVLRYDSANANGGGVGFLAPIVSPGNEQQKIEFTGFNLGDTFTLTCPNGEPSEEITYYVSSYFGDETGHTIIQEGLEESCGKGDFATSGNPPSTTVTFKGGFGGANQPQMTCTVLTGTGSCSVTTTNEGYPGALRSGNPSSATAGLAVDPATDTLYVLRQAGGLVVQQFGPTNEPGLNAAPLATDDTHGVAAGFSSASGFGLDSASGRLFLSLNQDPDSYNGPLLAHRVYVLADSSALPNPTANMSSAITAITDRSAVFHGTVNPMGGRVGCTFQYSADEVKWTDVDVPSCATLSENGGTQTISQSVSGLVPDTQYDVRLQVTRPYFSSFTPITVTAGGASFTTSAGLPVLAKVTARALDEHSVRLAATIDPSNSSTSYVVQYGPTPSLGSSTAPVSIGAGSEPVEVAPVIGGLNPATQYYFKLVAINLTGSAASKGLAVATYGSPASFGACPNDRFRTGPSAKLPDCRAYEQVTPTDKYGSDAFGTPYSVQASAAGDGITSYTFSGFPGGEGFQNSNVFLSRFAAGEWSIVGLNPPASYGDSGLVLGWTSDLGLTFARARSSAGGPGNNLLMRDSADGSRALLIPQGVGFSPQSGFAVGGAFDNDSKVVFQATGAVPVSSGPAATSTAPNVYLYDRGTGDVTLAGLLPDSACGSPPCVPASGSTLPPAFESYVQEGHAVSSNGDVYFVDSATGQLYVRRDVGGPGAATTQVAASERTDCADHDPCNGAPEPDPAGTFKPTFMGATADGSPAFFRSRQKLTDDSLATAGAQDLYGFDPNAPSGQRLSDLAPGAAVVGVLGYSDSGDRVYFAGNGDLDGEGPAGGGDCAGTGVGFFDSFSGTCSAYLWQRDGTGSCASAGGCVGFVARLSSDTGFGGPHDGFDWGGGEGQDGMKTSRVSADGRILVFRSQRQLTAYDNSPALGSECSVRCSEFYRYDAESGQITCLTCAPTGAPPTSEPDLKNPDLFHAPTGHGTFSVQLFLSRNLSPDGNRFFFQSAEKLVAADVNGEVSCSNSPKEEVQIGSGPSCRDVYEWEAPGTPGGSCTKDGPAYSAANGGCIYLLSTGTGAYPSYLADVSESGDTAFIFSRQQLLPSDEDTQEDIYAVKVDGGLAYQHAVRSPICEGDACRGAASQPSDASGAGTAVFEGPGNPKQNTNATRCPKGKRTVRSKGKVRCVAKHKKHKRAANHNRRASR